ASAIMRSRPRATRTRCNSSSARRARSCSTRSAGLLGTELGSAQLQRAAAWAEPSARGALSTAGRAAGEYVFQDAPQLLAAGAPKAAGTPSVMLTSVDQLIDNSHNCAAQ